MPQVATCDPKLLLEYSLAIRPPQTPQSRTTELFPRTSPPPPPPPPPLPQMQVIRPILVRLFGYPNVGTSATPMHRLSSPCRFPLSFMASATTRWWPPALEQRASPLIVSPNPPVSRVYRCVFLDLMLNFAPLLGCYSFCIDVDCCNLWVFVYPS